MIEFVYKKNWFYDNVHELLKNVKCNKFLLIFNYIIKIL